MSPMGYLALVLHSHLPYLHHRHPVLEERWLYEAVIECYLPLLEVMDNLVSDEVAFGITISLSPTLMSMLEDPLLRRRTLKHMESLLVLGERECFRTREDPVFHHLAHFYLDRLQRHHNLYVNVYHQDLIGAFKRLGETGKVEIITCAGTHPYLPLLKTEEGREAQIQVATDFYQKHFGRPCRGFWLPECGYTPGVERILARHGLNYFLVDTHGLLGADPRPPSGAHRPVAVASSGVAAFARDQECAAQVWNRLEGYPGDPVYREFYRDIGYDLSEDYLEPFLPGGIRVDTGFKYYRITGNTADKQPYNPEAATAKYSEHASNFLFNREYQLEDLANRIDHPVVVAPYDTELFGHWWYEGPGWLDQVCRQAADKRQVRLVTLGQYLSDYPPQDNVRLGLTSWGEGGYNRVWLNPSNDFLYRHLHAAEEEMVDQATIRMRPLPDQERILNQMSRELMLAQSSDWAFILNAGTATGYALTRQGIHLERFYQLRQQLDQGLNQVSLEAVEQEDNLFPDLSFQVYRRKGAVAIRPHSAKSPSGPTVLHLTWEYPPRVVGGIAPHVYNLSQSLSSLGTNVHVLTINEGPQSVYESSEGVQVYRLAVWPQSGTAFRDWVFQFNLLMTDFVLTRVETGRPPWQIIHAHDWVVAFAAIAIAKHYHLPMVATIHATEHGRNQGLHSQEQRAIHEVETLLSSRADKVICCSKYMHREIQSLFQVSADKLVIVPNGVEFGPTKPGPNVLKDENGRFILFVGRLVVEKGVQYLLQAFPAILAAIPDARLVIGGSGPYAETLHRLTRNLGITERVVFTGFINAPVRDSLLQQAAAAVFPSIYEPFGIVALEAMAAGCPTVVAATGGLAETVTDGYDGLLVPPGDQQALAQAVIKLLSRPDLAARLSANARQTVQEKYCWSDIARTTMEIYREVVTQANIASPGLG